LLQKERKSVTITIQFKLANKRVQEDVFKKNFVGIGFFFHVGFSRREGCAIFLICDSFFKKKDYFSFFSRFL